MNKKEPIPSQWLKDLCMALDAGLCIAKTEWRAIANEHDQIRLSDGDRKFIILTTKLRGGNPHFAVAACCGVGTVAKADWSNSIGNQEFKRITSTLDRAENNHEAAV